MQSGRAQVEARLDEEEPKETDRQTEGQADRQQTDRQTDKTSADQGMKREGDGEMAEMEMAGWRKKGGSERVDDKRRQTTGDRAGLVGQANLFV